MHSVMQEGKVPKLEKILDSDSEEDAPDVELQIPAHKVGLLFVCFAASCSIAALIVLAVVLYDSILPSRNRRDNVAVRVPRSSS